MVLGVLLLFHCVASASSAHSGRPVGTYVLQIPRIAAAAAATATAAAGTQTAASLSPSSIGAQRVRRWIGQPFWCVVGSQSQKRGSSLELGNIAPGYDGRQEAGRGCPVAYLARKLNLFAAERTRQSAAATTRRTQAQCCMR